MTVISHLPIEALRDSWVQLTAITELLVLQSVNDALYVLLCPFLTRKGNGVEQYARKNRPLSKAGRSQTPDAVVGAWRSGLPSYELRQLLSGKISKHCDISLVP